MEPAVHDPRPPRRPAARPSLRVDDFDYALPEGLIAQVPAPRREDARLLVVDKAGPAGPAGLQDAAVRQLHDHLDGDELLVLNETRVVPARLLGHKPTGGAVELLVLERSAERPDRVLALGRASRALRPGTPVQVGPARFEIVERLDDGHYVVALPPEADDLWSFLEAHGEVPLPPYIHREGPPGPEDAARYQTVFARHPGSVAAPTAGLHFTAQLLDGLRALGCAVTAVTLHVGPGTFLPVRAERLDDHEMHRERFEVPPAAAEALRGARADGRPVLAVGTTVVRTLEAVAAAHDGAIVPGAGTTDLFIAPGFPFQVVDRLLTNFHLPRSTLLMLVAAFAGRGRVLDAYAHAVRQGYRFFSYGDAMLIR